MVIYQFAALLSKQASCGSFVICETLSDTALTTCKLCAISLCLWRTRHRICSTTKILPLFPSVLCMLSPVVHGMTLGCLRLKEHGPLRPVIAISTSSERAFEGDHGCFRVDQRQLRKKMLLFSSAFASLHVSISFCVCTCLSCKHN